MNYRTQGGVKTSDFVASWSEVKVACEPCNLWQVFEVMAVLLRTVLLTSEVCAH